MNKRKIMGYVSEGIIWFIMMMFAVAVLVDFQMKEYEKKHTKNYYPTEICELCGHRDFKENLVELDSYEYLKSTLLLMGYDCTMTTNGLNLGTMYFHQKCYNHERMDMLFKSDQFDESSTNKVEKYY